MDSSDSSDSFTGSMTSSASGWRPSATGLAKLEVEAQAKFVEFSEEAAKLVADAEAMVSRLPVGFREQVVEGFEARLHTLLVLLPALRKSAKTSAVAHQAAGRY